MASDRPDRYARDRGRDFMALSGPDAVSYLQGQCSQDVAALGIGQAADALLLEPNGKLSALVRVIRTGAESFVIDTDGGFGELVTARLLRFKLRTKMVIDPLDWTCLAVRGSAITSVADLVEGNEPAPPADPETGPLYLPFEWNGWQGYDLVGQNPTGPKDVAAVTPEQWERWRIESGVPVMGKELDERTVPAEAGLLDRAVSFTKGCYTGQELVGRLDARGNKVPRRLMGLVAAEGTIEVGDELATAGAQSLVTSSAFSVALDRSIGLAYLHRSVGPGATVQLSSGAKAVAHELPLVGG